MPLKSSVGSPAPSPCAVAAFCLGRELSRHHRPYHRSWFPWGRSTGRSHNTRWSGPGWTLEAPQESWCTATTSPPSPSSQSLRVTERGNKTTVYCFQQRTAVLTGVPVATCPKRFSFHFGCMKWKQTFPQNFKNHQVDFLFSEPPLLLKRNQVLSQLECHWQ